VVPFEEARFLHRSQTPKFTVLRRDQSHVVSIDAKLTIEDELVDSTYDEASMALMGTVP
jgi:hypothetical protein